MKRRRTPKAKYPSLTVCDSSSASDVPGIRWLGFRLKKIACQLQLADAAVSFVLIRDRQMADLHEKYSGVKGTTDVLTFDFAESPDPLRPEGEVYVCVDEARRRSRSMKHKLENEVLLYCVHGLLHLLGYDDQKPADFRKMHQEEDRLLEAIGIGVVFRQS